jgi:hypothetical protein
MGAHQLQIAKMQSSSNAPCPNRSCRCCQTELEDEVLLLLSACCSASRAGCGRTYMQRGGLPRGASLLVHGPDAARARQYKPPVQRAVIEAVLNRPGWWGRGRALAARILSARTINHTSPVVITTHNRGGQT